MRFCDLLHSEIVLNKRGDKTLREIYQTTLELFLPDGSINLPIINKSEIHKMLYGMLAKDMIQLTHNIIIKKFTESPKSFYSPKEFINALLQIQKEDIPLDMLKNAIGFCGYFHFPENLIKDEDGSVWGGYVYITNVKNAPISFVRNKELKEDTVVVYFSYVSKKGVISTFTFIVPDKDINIRKELNESKHLEGLKAKDFGLDLGLGKEIDNDKRTIIYNLLLNLTIYYHSSNPDIIKLKPQYGMKKNEKKESGNDPVKNFCMTPVTLLSWNFHNEFTKRYSTDSWGRIGHFKWQRCGEGFKNVKLIWIDPTICHRNKDLLKE